MSRGFFSTLSRLALFFGTSGFIVLFWLIRRFFLSSDQHARVAAQYSQVWSKVTLKLLGIKVLAHGSKPRPPFFLVTNHLGYLDIAVIASQIPCTFVSKSEVAHWPVFGTLAKLSGTLFIDRKSMRDTERVNSKIKAHFKSGGSLVLFPEGTSTDGNGIAPFRSSLLDYPIQSEMPVHCASIRYFSAEGNPPASESMCWWGEMTLLPHFIQLFRMKGMAAVVSFAPEVILGQDRKTLAKDLQENVTRGIEKLQPLDSDVVFQERLLSSTH